jgi:hypothetical protein
MSSAVATKRSKSGPSGKSPVLDMAGIVASSRTSPAISKFESYWGLREQPYHRADPAMWLNRTAALVRTGNQRSASSVPAAAEKKEVEPGDGRY